MYPANIYLFKVNKRNIRKISGLCSKLTIKTPERRDVVLVILLLTYFTPFYSVSIAAFEQVNANWVTSEVAIHMCSSSIT